MRFHCIQLCVQPRTAGVNLRIARLLVNTSLASFGGRPLEVFYNSCDVNLSAVDACLNQSLIQQLSRRSDKRMPRKILLIAGLLAHEHDRSVGRTLAENCLCRVLPQVTSPAILSGATQPGEGKRLRSGFRDTLGIRGYRIPKPSFVRNPHKRTTP